MSLEWAYKHCTSHFVLKISDDSFVEVNNLLRLVDSINGEDVYMGERVHISTHPERSPESPYKVHAFFVMRLNMH